MPPVPSTNGHDQRSLKELREQRRLVVARMELAKIERANALLEDIGWSSWPDYLDFGGSDLFFRARTDTQWARVPPSSPSDRKHGERWPLWRTEADLRRIRQQARLLLGVNSFAQGLLRNRRNYTIGKGFAYKAKARGVKGGEQVPERTQKIVHLLQQFVDRFLKRNVWNAVLDPAEALVISATAEQECYNRVAGSDGEAFLRLHYEADGHTLISFIEPEQIETGEGSIADGISFGIQHQMEPFEDTRRPVRYYVKWQDPATAQLHQNTKGMGEWIDAREVLHLKGSDTPSNVKRGISPFAFDVARALERASKLQRNISVGAGVRAATAEIWQGKGFTKAQMEAWAGNEATSQEVDPSSGDAYSVEQRKAGNIRRIPAGLELAPRDQESSMPGYLAGLGGDLRQAVAAFAVPEYFLGDTAGGNYSNLESASAPAVKNGETEQEYYRIAFGAVIGKAILHGIAKNVLPSDALQLAEIQVEAPAVLHRDKLQKSQADQIDISIGKKSPQTAAMEDGLDPETELLNAREYQEKMGQQGQSLSMPDAQDGQEPGLARGPVMNESIRALEARLRLLESKDDSGHEHDSSSGQFTGSGDSGSKSKKPSENDPVHGYLAAFVDTEIPATPKDARDANRDLKSEGSKFRVVPDGKGGWEAAHAGDLKNTYGESWAIVTNSLTGEADIGDREYFEELKKLAGDKETRSYLHAFNDPKGEPTTKDDVATANADLAKSGNPHRIEYNEDYKLWVARKGATESRQGEAGQSERPFDDVAAVRDLLSGLYEMAGEEPPDLDDEAIRKALGTKESLTEEGFTGIDSHGHKWIAGKQVKRDDADSSQSKGALGKAGDILSGAGKALTAKATGLLGKVKDYAAQKFKGLEEKFGRKGAVAIMAASLALTPVPVPGTSLAPLLVAHAIKHVAGLLKGKESASAEVGVAPGATKPSAGSGQKTHVTPEHKAVHARLLEGMDKLDLPPGEATARSAGLKRVLLRMPAKAVALIAGQADVKTSWFADVKALSEQARATDLKTVSPTSNINGTFNGTTGEIRFDGATGKGNAPGMGIADRETNHHGTYAHELGHVLDRGYKLSGDIEWRAAYKAEVYRELSQDAPLSEYARLKAWPHEGFAEFARAVYGSDVGHAETKRKFPKCWAFFVSRGLVEDI